eukprot:TRINITY_DN8306_c0_g1_i1.p1 TRINITY_DN8306_c0_g1~~TRINITY_DN8306_c0_g1_i1.p1  ORF type:complete len:206 (-),score=20.24 TRINITY_DN8306_c0_g1_i1:443-1060(-)
MILNQLKSWPSKLELDGSIQSAILPAFMAAGVYSLAWQPPATFIRTVLLHFRSSNGTRCSIVNACAKNFHSRNGRTLRMSATGDSKTESSMQERSIPSWARPGSDELPPWARDEVKSQTDERFEIPFYVYLLSSAIVAIAAVGSMFEYANQKPVFGVLNPESVFYAPVLGFFVITGIPTSVFLWFKSIRSANKAAEEQDRRDGYL